MTGGGLGQIQSAMRIIGGIIGHVARRHKAAVTHYGAVAHD